MSKIRWFGSLTPTTILATFGVLFTDIFNGSSFMGSYASEVMFNKPPDDLSFPEVALNS
jgi:hypothetical protein